MPEREFNGPVIGLQQRYREGLAALGEDFADVEGKEQRRRLRADEDFCDLLWEHCCQGMYGAPEYGGNRDCVGWPTSTTRVTYSPGVTATRRCRNRERHDGRRHHHRVGSRRRHGGRGADPGRLVGGDHGEGAQPPARPRRSDEPAGDYSNDEIKFITRWFLGPDPLVEPRAFRRSADEGEHTHVGEVNSIPTTVGGGGTHADGKVPRFREEDFRMRSTYGPQQDADVPTGPSTTTRWSRTTPRSSGPSASSGARAQTRSPPGGRAPTRCRQGRRCTARCCRRRRPSEIGLPPLRGTDGRQLHRL